MLEVAATSDLLQLLIEIHDKPTTLEVLQRFLDRYLHQARNRLNTIRLALYMARRNLGRDASSLTPMETAYHELQHFLESFQRFSLPIELTPVQGSLERFLGERVEEHNAHRDVLVHPTPQVLFTCNPSERRRSFDPNRLGPAFLEYLTFKVTATPRLDSLVIEAEDRGKSLHLSATEVFVGSSNAHSEPNLSLPWFARVVSAHGATFEHRPGNDLAWCVNWPG